MPSSRGSPLSWRSLRSCSPNGRSRPSPRFAIPGARARSQRPVRLGSASPLPSSRRDGSLTDSASDQSCVTGFPRASPRRVVRRNGCAPRRTCAGQSNGWSTSSRTSAALCCLWISGARERALRSCHRSGADVVSRQRTGVTTRSRQIRACARPRQLPPAPRGVVARRRATRVGVGGIRLCPVAAALRDGFGPRRLTHPQPRTVAQRALRRGGRCRRPRGPGARTDLRATLPLALQPDVESPMARVPFAAARGAARLVGRGGHHAWREG